MMQYQISNIKYRRGLFPDENQNCKSKIKNFLHFTLSFCILIFTFLFLYIQPTYALDSTPSADIKTKLEELKKEIASKAAKLKNEIGRKLNNKAYSGKVKSKSETSITLAASSGPKIVSTNQDTVFESKIKSRSKFNQKGISLEDNIAALGDTDETGVLIAKKIILLPEAGNEKPKTYLWGQVVSLTDKMITIKDKNSQNITVIVPPKSKIGINDTIILTGSKDKNDIFAAQFVYVVSQKTASPSASIASPSAKPSKKAS